MAFYSLEPFGYIANLHGDAITASVVAEVNRDSEKRSEPFTAQDFIPTEQQQQDEKPSVFQRLKDYYALGSSNSQSQTST
jgi:hypothetical protein